MGRRPTCGCCRARHPLRFYSTAGLVKRVGTRILSNHRVELRALRAAAHMARSAQMPAVNVEFPGARLGAIQAEGLVTTNALN